MCICACETDCVCARVCVFVCVCVREIKLSHITKTLVSTAVVAAGRKVCAFSVLQYVAVCCSMLQCVSVCCSVLLVERCVCLQGHVCVFVLGYGRESE